PDRTASRPHRRPRWPRRSRRKSSIHASRRLTGWSVRPSCRRLPSSRDKTMKHVVLLSLTIAIASIAEIRDVQGSSDYAILGKSSGATAGKGDAGVQPKGGGSLSAPAD